MSEPIDPPDDAPFEAVRGDDASGKAPAAYRTIGEVSRATRLPHHILRYWETRIPQLRPLQRAGGRRYYRPEDVALVVRIDAMLRRDGYTIDGVQRVLAREVRRRPLHPAFSQQPEPVANAAPARASEAAARLLTDAVRSVRAAMAAALDRDSAA